VDFGDFISCTDSDMDGSEVCACFFFFLILLWIDSKNELIVVSSLGLALDFESFGLMSGMELSFLGVTWGFFAMLPPTAMVLEL